MVVMVEESNIVYLRRIEDHLARRREAARKARVKPHIVSGNLLDYFPEQAET